MGEYVVQFSADARALGRDGQGSPLVAFALQVGGALLERGLAEPPGADVAPVT